MQDQAGLEGERQFQLAVQAIKLGADHFMTKPVELASLKLILDRLVANRRSRKREAARSRRAARKPREHSPSTDSNWLGRGGAAADGSAPGNVP